MSKLVSFPTKNQALRCPDCDGVAWIVLTDRVVPWEKIRGYIAELECADCAYTFTYHPSRQRRTGPDVTPC